MSSRGSGIVVSFSHEALAGYLDYPYGRCWPPQFWMTSSVASVSSSVDKTQQFGPQRVHATPDLEHARKMIMAG
jgi:hypothetical protein